VEGVIQISLHEAMAAFHGGSKERKAVFSNDGKIKPGFTG
jgi:hypothetical protein